MKICGIITEYNPFHLGHKFQIQETKKQLDIDIVIVVMSGNFVQRGEPAIFDKYTRTKLALSGGADIVIELPTPFATSSAETFAYGAIDLLNNLGVVDYLCFGSELGDLGPIQKLADFLVSEPANFKNAIKSELKSGLSYAKARSNALKATFGENDEILKGSNNILGIEYLKSLKTLHSNIEPYTIRRVGASYLSESIDDVLPSATAIRKYFKESKQSDKPDFKFLNTAMPTSVIETLIHLENYNPIYMEDLYPTFRYLLEVNNTTTIETIYDCPEELFNRLANISSKTMDYETFIDEAVSKNYTKTTIQRALIHLYLNIKTDEVNKIKVSGNEYCHILGFKKEASKALQAIKKNESIKLVTNIKDHQRDLNQVAKQTLLNEVSYTKLYNQLIYNKYQTKKKNDYQEPVIIR